MGETTELLVGLSPTTDLAAPDSSVATSEVDRTPHFL